MKTKTLRKNKVNVVTLGCSKNIVDSEVLSCCCLAEALATYDVKLELGEALALFLGRSTAAVVQHYGAEGRSLPDNFLPDLKARVREAFRSSLQPIPGVNLLLAGLHTPHCVASSSDLDRVSFSLGLTGLAPYFADRVYTSQMVARGKPAPDLFLYAAAKMRAEPRKTLVIEDSVSGVAAAKAAGMTAWGFIGGSHYERRDGRALLYEAGADRVFDRMADFWTET